jgi:hypothetical protein
MPERGQVFVLTGGRPAERWRWYTALYPYLAFICQDHGTGALPRPHWYVSRRSLAAVTERLRSDIES